MGLIGITSLADRQHFFLENHHIDIILKFPVLVYLYEAKYDNYLCAFVAEIIQVGMINQ